MRIGRHRTISAEWRQNLIDHDHPRDSVGGATREAVFTVRVQWQPDSFSSPPNQQPTDQEVLTVEEVAEILKRAPSTIRTWLGKGMIPGALKLGREWRVPRTALDRFLETQATVTLKGIPQPVEGR